MISILQAEPIGKVVVGVDTHKYVHTAVAVDVVGGVQVQGTTGVPADRGGYEQLDTWARQFGRVLAFGVEGTGSHGAGLASHLRRHGHKLVEVNRPDRRVRRQRGKSDPIDAENAARAVLAGTATATAKSAEGTVEMVRHIKIARDGAGKARTQAMVTLKALIVTVPDELRQQLQGLPKTTLIERCAGLRPGPVTSPAASAKHSIRAMARRWKDLNDEVKEHDALLGALTKAHAPELVDAFGIGADTAAEVPVTVGDNPERIRSQAAFGKLAGGLPRPGLVRQDEPAPAQPRRSPTTELRALPRGDRPHALPPTHDRLRCPAHSRGQDETGDHPLPQALSDPRDLPVHEGTMAHSFARQVDSAVGANAFEETGPGSLAAHREQQTGSEISRSLHRRL